MLLPHNESHSLTSVRKAETQHLKSGRPLRMTRAELLAGTPFPQPYRVGTLPYQSSEIQARKAGTKLARKATILPSKFYFNIS